MSNTNRIILVISVILTLTALAGLGYTMYHTTATLKKVVNQPAKTVETVKDDNAVHLSGLFKKMSYSEVSYIRNVLDLKDEKAFSSVLVSTDMQGTVADIKENGYLDPQTPYRVRIDLSIPGRTTPLPVFYTKEEYAKVKATPALGNIKKGDRISVKETYDLVNFDLVKGEISTLK